MEVNYAKRRSGKLRSASEETAKCFKEDGKGRAFYYGNTDIFKGQVW